MQTQPVGILTTADGAGSEACVGTFGETSRLAQPPPACQAGSPTLFLPPAPAEKSISTAKNRFWF